MTEGREPGAPPDLSEIRRTDEIIDQLASHRRPHSRAFLDPAVAVLASLITDVDAAPLAPVRGRRHRSAAAAAAVAFAAAAAVVAATGFVIVAMFSRLTGACRWGNRG